MAKILQKYIKFSSKELEEYAANPQSCVRRIRQDMHLSMGPYGMADFKHALHDLLIRTKVGIYDASLQGIVLDVKKIKVLSQAATLRADDPSMHIIINADFYVFRPVNGAVLKGVVRHVSSHQVSAVIYRVFNTSLLFADKNQNHGIVMDQDITFRIKKFDIRNVMPYIEGELVADAATKSQVRLYHRNPTVRLLTPALDSQAQNKSIKFGSPEPEEEDAVTVKSETESEMLDGLLEELQNNPDLLMNGEKKSSRKRKKETIEEVTLSPKKVKKEIKDEPV
ncbi:hypothetical protein KR018_012250 [Drosophila ironensis]|nr:hypothetical protein KR018_012250 [Drosophila ironensis]